MQAPIEHGRSQGGRTRHNRGRGGRNSRANREARKAARCGAHVWARSDSQPEARAAEQTDSDEVTITLRWSEGWALLEVKAGQHASSAGVHGLKAAGTFDVDACGGSCAQSGTHQGTTTSGDTCGSTHSRSECTNIDDTMVGNEEAHADGIIELDSPTTPDGSNVGGGVFATKPHATIGSAI